MDVLQLLRDDHLRVKDLFRRFDEVSDASTRKAIVDEAIAELMVHSQLEEEIFYPAMEREGMRDLIGHAEEEHQAAENLMNEIVGLNTRDSAIEAKFRFLVDLVVDHINEEESELFPRAAEIGPAKLARIGEQVTELRERILTAPPKPRSRTSTAKTSTKRTTAMTSTRRTTPIATAASSGSARSATSRVRASGASRAKGATSSRAPTPSSEGASGATTAGATTRATNGSGKGKTSRTAASTRSTNGNGNGSAATSTTGANGRRLDTLTLEELYGRAQKAGVTGRSNMSKDELVRALRK